MPQVGDQLFVTLKAADNCALPAGHQCGAGGKYQLDIVPPEQLLSMLEGRELMLRRRFEVIYQEMLDTRDGLARIDFAPPDAKAGADDKAIASRATSRATSRGGRQAAAATCKKRPSSARHGWPSAPPKCAICA